jgi:hypothetical protein
MSSSAFCYDLGLNAGPDATVSAPVYCVKKGKVIEYKDDDDSAPREGNRVILKIDKTRAFGYLHLKKGSTNSQRAMNAVNSNSQDCRNMRSIVMV